MPGNPAVRHSSGSQLYCCANPKRIAVADHFLTSVLREPKLFVCGDVDELGRLGASGVSTSPADEDVLRVARASRGARRQHRGGAASGRAAQGARADSEAAGRNPRSRAIGGLEDRAPRPVPAPRMRPARRSTRAATLPDSWRAPSAAHPRSNCSRRITARHLDHGTRFPSPRQSTRSRPDPSSTPSLPPSPAPATW